MESAEIPQNERKLLRIIVWASTVSVAGSVALMFGFDNSGGQFRYEFTLASVIAFVVSLVVMGLFWKKVFSLLHDMKRMWRFCILSSIGVIALFIGMIFLPQFRPIGNNSSDLLQGLILGFLAVAAVFYFARVSMRMLEKGDEESDGNR